MSTPKSNRTNIWFAGAALGGVFLVTGCVANRERVFATTATVIGVQIHQKDADKTPELKIGYARAELAIVPTDRHAKEDGSTSGSATNSAEVLMEINAQGSLALGSMYQGGVYQRLAVGHTAVQQPGAAFMMAKDKNGNIDPVTANSIQRATSTITNIAPVTDSVTLAKQADLCRRFSGASSADKDKFEAAALSAGYPATGHPDHPAFRNFCGDAQVTADKVQKITDAVR